MPPPASADAGWEGFGWEVSSLWSGRGSHRPGGEAKPAFGLGIVYPGWAWGGWGDLLGRCCYKHGVDGGGVGGGDGGGVVAASCPRAGRQRPGCFQWWQLLMPDVWCKSHHVTMPLPFP